MGGPGDEKNERATLKPIKPLAVRYNDSRLHIDFYQLQFLILILFISNQKDNKILQRAVENEIQKIQTSHHGNS